MCGENVRVGLAVTIGAYAILEDGVSIGDGCRIGAHAILRSGTTLGERSVVDSFAVLGGPPQDLRFDDSIATGVEVGVDVTIREGATINRSTDPLRPTTVGPGSLLMAHSHVAHDCRIGASVVIANNVLLGGHVEIGDFAWLGGAAGIHQFVRVGQSAMVGGHASISCDVPPFVMVTDRNALRGLNHTGLRRRGLPAQDVAAVRDCFRSVCLREGDPRAHASLAISQGTAGESKLGLLFLEFFSGGARGFARIPRFPGRR